MNRLLVSLVSGVILLGAAACSPVSRVSQSSVVLAQSSSGQFEAMTLERLEAVIKEEGSNVQGRQGQWQFTLDGKSVLVIADATNNRMRIISPVTTVDKLSEQQVQAILLANFHSALDARYAVTGNALVSVYVHPLSSLQDADFRSAISQVATLATNFGTSYSSGGLGFLPNREQPEEATPFPEGNIGI